MSERIMFGNVDLTAPHTPRPGERLRITLTDGTVCEVLVADLAKNDDGGYTLTLESIPDDPEGDAAVATIRGQR